MLKTPKVSGGGEVRPQLKLQIRNAFAILRSKRRSLPVNSDRITSRESLNALITRNQQDFPLYKVPKILSPASPKPGKIYPRELSFLSKAAA